MTKRKQIERMSFNMPPDMAKNFDLLSNYMRIQKSVYCREAIADLLKKHAEKLREAIAAGGKPKD